MLATEPGSEAGWGRAFTIAGSVHALAIASLFLHLVNQPEPSTELPAIAVVLAAPAAVPAPFHDTPTPRQIEAPKQTPPKQPQPKMLPFDTPPLLQIADVKPEVQLPPKKVDPVPVEKLTPRPPAPATTELAAPDRKPDTRTTASAIGGVSAGKVTAADLWYARVPARIELNKRYPGAAAANNQVDDVDVLIAIDRSGRLVDAHVRSSKNLALLDGAALEAVRRASPFARPPPEVEGDPIRVSVIIRFRTRGR